MPKRGVLIKLDNVQDGEIVNHGLLLIRGRLECDGEHSKEILSKEIFLVKVDHGNNLRTSKAVDVNKKCRFKCLIRLGQGCNQIQFQILDTCKAIQVEFHRPRRHPEPLVELVYILCKGSEGFYQSPNCSRSNDSRSACQKISIMALLAQSFYAEGLQSLGYHRKTFQLDLDHREVPKVLKFHSSLDKQKALQMSSEQLWSHFGTELIRNGVISDNNKVLAIMADTEYRNPRQIYPEDHQHLLSMTKCHAALGIGGLALFGSGCLYTWPENLDDIEPALVCDTPVDWKNFMDDSSFRHTLGGCFATNLGAIVHELGHCFDLAHEDSGIMATGYQDVDIAFTSFVEAKPVLPRNFPDSLENFRLKQKYHKVVEFSGQAFWTVPNAIILSHHRWLNSGVINGPEAKIRRVGDKIVSLGSDLVLLEIRRSGFVIYSQVLKEIREFQWTRLNLNPQDDIFVMNKDGMTFKMQGNKS